MQKKWGIITIVIIIILGGAAYAQWFSKNEHEVLKYILNTSSDIDSIIVKDGKTNEELVLFTNSDPAFSELVKFYISSHYLEGEDKNKLTGEPFAEIEYYDEDELKFTVNIFELDDAISFNQSPDLNLGKFKYTPSGKNNTYVYSIKEDNIIFGMNNEMRQLINKLIN